MALENVKEVRVVFDVGQLNAYLKAGWVLVAAAPGKAEDESPSIKYSIGWDKEGKAVHPQ